MIKIKQHVQALAKEKITAAHANNQFHFNTLAKKDPAKFLPDFAIDPRPFTSIKNNSKLLNKLTGKSEGEWIAYMLKNGDSYFDYLADRHWEHLKSDGIVNNINTIINNTQTQKYLEEIAGNDTDTRDAQEEFLKMLCANNALLLKQLITAKPKHLKKLANFIFSKISEKHFLPSSSGRKKTRNEFTHMLLSKIFTYDKYRKSPEFQENLISLGFKSARCPYCNIQLLQVTKDKAYLQGDHFLAKYKYPFLALSFYNLIPSCSCCNTMDKSTKEFTLDTHANPFIMASDKIYTFEFPTQSLLSSTIDTSLIGFSRKKITDKTFKDLDTLSKNIETEKINIVHNMILNNAHKIFWGTNQEVEELARNVKTHVPGNADNILRFEFGKILRDMILQHNAPAYSRFKNHFL